MSIIKDPVTGDISYEIDDTPNLGELNEIITLRKWCVEQVRNPSNFDVIGWILDAQKLSYFILNGKPPTP